MLVALNSAGQRVVAWQIERNDTFACPECGESLVVRKGAVKIHHFAHRADRGCEYGAGETEAHRQAKYRIYSALQNHPMVFAAELEHSLGSQRADVSFFTRNGYAVAVELQRSNLTVEEIKRRTLGYTQMGFAVLWIAIGLQAQPGIEFRVREWQKWLHAMWYGKVFTLSNRGKIEAWKFEDVCRTGGEYYVPGGQGETEWAADRTLRSTKTLRKLGDFDLVQDMQTKIHKAWNKYPEAFIWDLR